MAFGDVLNVDEVHRRRDHRGQPAAQVAAHDPRRGPAGLGAVKRRPNEVAGVDDDQLDVVAGGGIQSHPLALVLGVGVGKPHPVPRVSGSLVRGEPVAGRTDCRDR